VAGYTSGLGNKVRILHLVTALNIGGAEKHLYKLVSHMPRERYDIDVAYLRAHEGRFAGAFEQAGFQVYPLDMQMRLDGTALWRLTQLLRAREYDIVHTHLPRSDVVGSIALSLAPGPLLISSKHNQHDFLHNPLVRSLVRWTGRKEVHAIAISRAVRDYYVRLGLVRDPKRISVIYYGLNVDQIQREYQARRVELETFRRSLFGDDALVVGTVARLTRQKGLGYLLRAMATVIRREPRARLVVVGTGEQREDLEALAGRLGIAEHVLLAGFQEDIVAWVSCMDVFVLPSLWEGFGLALLEAMALARPVVATRVGPIPEVVVDQETGILVPPQDVSGLVAAIGALLQDEERRVSLGRAGLRRAFERFSLQEMVVRTTQVYDDCLNGRDPSYSGANHPFGR